MVYKTLFVGLKARSQNIDKVLSLQLDFDTKSMYRAAIYYWLTQLMLGRLCSRLNVILRDVADTVNVPSTEEVRRMLKNVLMSWQYTSQAGTVGSAVTSLLIVVS